MLQSQEPDFSLLVMVTKMVAALSAEEKHYSPVWYILITYAGQANYIQCIP